MTTNTKTLMELIAEQKVNTRSTDFEVITSKAKFKEVTGLSKEMKDTLLLIRNITGYHVHDSKKVVVVGVFKNKKYEYLTINIAEGTVEAFSTIREAKNKARELVKATDASANTNKEEKAEKTTEKQLPKKAEAKKGV